MQKSEQVNELFAALAKARGDFGEIKKDTINPFFGKKYADLSSIITATSKQLSANGLAVIQLPGNVADGKVDIETILSHSSGQWISERIQMPVEGTGNAQKIGSALTYGRRYAYQALLNIAAEEDDDGQAAVEKVKAAEKRFDDARISPVNVRKFWQEARKTGHTNEQVAAYLADLGHTQTEQLKQSEYDAALQWAMKPLPVPSELVAPLQESLSMANATKAKETPGKPDPMWKTFWALAKRHGIPEADVHTYAREHFGMKQSLTELNAAEVGKIAEWIAGEQP